MGQENVGKIVNSITVTESYDICTKQKKGQVDGLDIFFNK